MLIERARRSDLAEVLALLERHHLPLDGLSQHVDTMVVARGEGRIIGAAALELYSEGALLRSVVVETAAQGKGLGHGLTEAALNVARDHNIPTVFLLTTTAERFFPRLGFARVSREEVPVSVQASVEFQSACPVSATVMRRKLVGDDR